MNVAWAFRRGVPSSGVRRTYPNQNAEVEAILRSGLPSSVSVPSMDPFIASGPLTEEQARALVMFALEVEEDLRYRENKGYREGRDSVE